MNAEATRHAAGPEVDSYAGMIDSLRGFLDRVAGARPTAEESADIAVALDALSARLDERQVPEQEQVFGRLRVPGRAQVMCPAYVVDDSDALSSTARVTFGRYFLGGNGAAHGGSLPLLLDDVLGRLANTGGRAGARTAYLTVNFRSIARIGRELTVAARFVKEEGRKRYLAAEVLDGDVLVADAEALFVELRPGQP